MVAVSHLLTVDESGSARVGSSIQSLWVAAGVTVPFESARQLDGPLEVVRVESFRRRVKEPR